VQTVTERHRLEWHTAQKKRSPKGAGKGNKKNTLPILPSFRRRFTVQN